MRQAEIERKKFQSRIPFKLDPGKKVPKEIAKKFKKLKNPFPALYLDKTGDEIGREREKTILVPNSVPTRPWEENCEKKQQKNSKN